MGASLFYFLHMNRKRNILILVAAIFALFTAGIMSGAISFNPMPDLYQEYWEGSIQNTSYTLHSWTIEILDPDTLRVYLNGTAQDTDDYVFEIAILDAGAWEVCNATRAISLTSGVNTNEQFTFSASGIVSDFTYIDLEITR